MAWKIWKIALQVSARVKSARFYLRSQTTGCDYWLPSRTAFNISLAGYAINILETVRGVRPCAQMASPIH
jgi:hypothetical protein